MAAIDLIGYDAGATGSAQLPVHGSLLVEIGEETRLADFVADCVEASQRFGTIGRLIIIAFGGETSGDESSGLRIFFGRDHIQPDTVHEFEPLAGKVIEILLVIIPKPHPEINVQSEQAGSSALADGFQGEGNEIGRQLALAVGIPVTLFRPRRARIGTEAFDRFVGYDIFAGDWAADPQQFDGQIVRFDETGTLRTESTSSAVLATVDDLREALALRAGQQKWRFPPS